MFKQRITNIIGRGLFNKLTHQQVSIATSFQRMITTAENPVAKFQLHRPDLEYEKKIVEEIEQVPYSPEDSKRCGVIAIKKGMTCLWDENGNQLPCTVLKIEDCQVVAHKTEEKDGYLALQVGAVNREQHKVTKPLLGHFAKNGVEPKHRLVEFMVSKDAILPVGTPLNCSHFLPGQFVDARAPSKGKGFQGGMKRHGFAGLRASHGVSLTHRSIGSTGQRAQPGKVFKGKKMPGRMGGEFVTVQNCQVLKLDTELNLIYLKGSIPGFAGQYVTLTDAVKKVGLEKFGLTRQQAYQPPENFAPPFPTLGMKDHRLLPREIVAKVAKEIPVAKKS